MDAQELAARWVRPEIQSLRAYPVPDSTGLIKLDAMENPWTWPAELRAEWARYVADLNVNRYPDPQAAALKEQLRIHDGVDPAHDLLLGNGSDEIIQLLALALGGPGRTILAPEPSFVMYRMIATFAGLSYRGVPLRAEDFALDLPAMLAAIEAEQPALVFLSVPNNPTGNVFSEADVAQIIAAAPGLVVIDEAYTAFTGHNALRLLDQCPNVVVMRTLSKLGLAGLRVGYLVGATAWLEQLEKVRLPYNINVLSQAAAGFALANAAMLAGQTVQICSERTRLMHELERFPLTTWPSEANFVLVRPHQHPAPEVHVALREAGILIKCLHGAHPLLDNCLRLTVGTPAENDALLAALAVVMHPAG